MAAYYVFKKESFYYIFYNQFNSDLNWLGKEIVMELENIDYELLEDYIERLTENDITDYNGKKFVGLMKALEFPEEVDFVNITLSEPVLELDINYIYIIDLDYISFKIKYYKNDECAEISFPLDLVPSDWAVQTLIHKYH